MCLWAIYVFPLIDLLILLQEICGPILGIYKSLTDTLNVEIGTEAAQIPRKGIHKWDFHCSAGKAWSTSLGCTLFTVPEPSWRNVHHCFDRWKFPWGRQAWIRPRWGLYYFPCQIIINYVGLHVHFLEQGNTCLCVWPQPTGLYLHFKGTIAWWYVFWAISSSLKGPPFFPEFSWLRLLSRLIPAIFIMP